MRPDCINQTVGNKSGHRKRHLLIYSFPVIVTAMKLDLLVYRAAIRTSGVHSVDGERSIYSTLPLKIPRLSFFKATAPIKIVNHAPIVLQPIQSLNSYHLSTYRGSPACGRIPGFRLSRGLQFFASASVIVQCRAAFVNSDNDGIMGDHELRSPREKASRPAS